MVFREVGTFEEISPLPCCSSAGWFMAILILAFSTALGWPVWRSWCIYIVDLVSWICIFGLKIRVKVKHYSELFVDSVLML